MDINFEIVKINIVENVKDHLNANFTFNITKGTSVKTNFLSVYFSKNDRPKIDRFQKRNLIDEFASNEPNPFIKSSCIKKYYGFFSEIENFFNSYEEIKKLKGNFLNDIFKLDINQYADEYIKDVSANIFYFSVNDYFEFKLIVFHNSSYNNMEFFIKNKYKDTQIIFRYTDKAHFNLDELKKRVVNCHKFRLKYILDANSN